MFWGAKKIHVLLIKCLETGYFAVIRFCSIRLQNLNKLKIFLGQTNGKASDIKWYFMFWSKILSLKGVIIKTKFSILGLPPLYAA